MVRWPRLTLADTAITLALAPRSSPWPFPLHLRALTRSSPAPPSSNRPTTARPSAHRAAA